MSLSSRYFLLQIEPIKTTLNGFLDEVLLAGFEFGNRYPKPFVRSLRQPNREGFDILRCVGVLVHWLDVIRKCTFVQ